MQCFKRKLSHIYIQLLVLSLCKPKALNLLKSASVTAAEAVLCVDKQCSNKVLYFSHTLKNCWMESKLWSCCASYLPYSAYSKQVRWYDRSPQFMLLPYNSLPPNFLVSALFIEASSKVIHIPGHLLLNKQNQLKNFLPWNQRYRLPIP